MEKTISLDHARVPAGAWKGRVSLFGLLALAGLALGAVGYVTDHRQFAFSYLVPFLFFLSIGLACQFVVMLQHLTRSGWSVVVRRIAETLMTPVPLFVLLFIPVALVIHELFHWSHQDAVANDALLRHKEPYLNTTFFLIRAAVYFLVWFLITRYFYGRSVAQDETHDPHTTVAMQRRAAPGIILFALTLSFMSVDWIMSLDPHWYSTIFGVYIFSGSTLAAFAVITLVALALERGGYLRGAIRPDHYRDLGRFLFAFSVFWAYIAFSQYFLIWYGNIPEETLFYVHRSEGSWKQASLLLAVGHFAVPFVLLMSRWVKSRPALVGALAVWVLLMHYLDVYWLVMPVLHHEGVSFHWMDLACFVGVGAVFLFLFTRRLAGRPLVPLGDPRLPESLRLNNDY